MVPVPYTYSSYLSLSDCSSIALMRLLFGSAPLQREFPYENNPFFLNYRDKQADNL